jgi:hypothetical protein
MLPYWRVLNFNNQFIFPFPDITWRTIDALPPTSDTYRECPDCGEQFSITRGGKNEDDERCCIDCAKVTCSCCDNKCAEEDTYDINGERVCNECSCMCEKCEEMILKDDAKEGRDGFGSRANTHFYCESCCWKCEDCGKRFSEDLDKSSNSNDEPICERCAESYCTCDGCSCIVHSDYVSAHDGNAYCSSCYDELDRDEDENDEDEEPDVRRASAPPAPPSRVQSYNFKPSPHFRCADGQSPQTLFFGIELEVDRREPSEEGSSADIVSAAIPDSFYCKEDGSLDHGFEIVSHPCTYEFFAKADWTFADKLRELEYRSYDTSTCGMHIHVSRAALSSLDILKLLEFFKRNPDFVLYLSRRDGKQAGKMEKWAAIDRADRKHIIQKINRDIGQEHDDRYEAINVLPRNTIEFRIFRGTLAKNSILRNIGFVRSLVAFVKQEAMEGMTLANYRKWLKSNAAKVLGRGEHAKALIKWIDGFDPSPIAYIGGNRLGMLSEDIAA